MPPTKTDEYLDGDYTSYKNYIPDIHLGSVDNLFDLKNFGFFAPIIVILFVLIVKNTSYMSTNFVMNIGITGIFVIVLITLYIFINSRKHIKNNILVIKTKLKDKKLEQILFKIKKDNKNNKLNLITIQNEDNESFDKNSVKNFFDQEFSQSLDDLDYNISEYYIYNKDTRVYYINVTINKSLLSGEERDNKNYRFIPINDLKDYNINKNNYNEDKYNENVLPILFKLNDDFFE